jgi:hypothetical protein
VSGFSNWPENLASTWQ